MAFTEEDYTTLTTSLNRMNAVKDTRTVIKKTLNVIRTNVTLLQSLLTTIGAADSLISQDIIDEITAIGTKFNSGSNNIENNHPIFLTGQDNE